MTPRQTKKPILSDQTGSVDIIEFYNVSRTRATVYIFLCHLAILKSGMTEIHQLEK